MANWVAVDWGTSNLRAWAMRGAVQVDFEQSEQGMGGLTPGAFEPALMDLIGDWIEGPTRVIACGMVGARQGWVEAAYRPVPCLVTAPDALTKAPTQDARLDMRIAPGICQAEPPDVMRGEETQIAGYLAQNPDFDGILCLPGTHTKWVHISAAEVVSFRTFMSGELFALLSQHSVLRHSVGADGWDAEAFADAVGQTLSRPERLAAELFGLRAAGLVGPQTPEAAKARLSGLLIGAELAAARPYWLGQDVAVLGDPSLTAHYAAALRLQGLAPREAAGDALALAGLTEIYMKGQ
ncbi:2-dehydro-3-deoxygalactonokinase [Candidatus Rhodobacter oscarellae]|uniref:2-dehydro-3-deoxygalactonokinase n=1 Tax=Candidatus Rhodobacter oscarellae TaxID=1675527 RepID=A0A0J9E0W0_9RHOB|nr:2-dehydro-3-deoxygalactonokinase [Candidatus Rhodobacter lobularis]KMW56307.1 2-dehydro-3-deoxygalactonokinase [Candidatus Rhodobacter lobularis]